MTGHFPLSEGFGLPPPASRPRDGRAETLEDSPAEASTAPARDNQLWDCASEPGLEMGSWDHVRCFC
eukprot:2578246-Pyramimonas_sp.AAC.1